MSEKITGIRCDKCKGELSHVVNSDPALEKQIVEHEDFNARQHKNGCDGNVTRFEGTTEEPAKSEEPT